MNADEFAGFWAAQGYKVISTRSCHWYNTEPFVFLSVPFHRMVTPDRGEMLRIWLQGRALVARYLSPAEESEANGGLYVCDDRRYDIPLLGPKARNHTRVGLRSCQIEQVEFSDLVKWGYEIDVQTYIRQGRDPGSLSREKWMRYCQAAGRTAGFEAWGAFIDGKPAAYVVCALIEDYYHLLRQSSATEYLRYCPNNALTFTLTQRALARPEVNYASYGLKSVEDTPGLNQYKESMGYTLKPLSDRLVINPVLRLVLNTGGAKAVRRLHERNPADDFWRKAARTVDLVQGSGYAGLGC